jgi:hypothetical protein
MVAYFVFDQRSLEGECKLFVFKLVDKKKIDTARSILLGTQPTKTHVQGTIVKSPASYNQEWSFHLDPSSIDFFEMQIEVCDANVTYVERHLDEVGGSTLPKNFWCPWSSRLLMEITEQVDPITELVRIPVMKVCQEALKRGGVLPDAQGPRSQE